MPQTTNEALLDAAVRHQVKLLRFSAGEAAWATRLLDQSEKELVAKLQAGLAEASADRVEALLGSMRQLRSAVHEQLSGHLKQSLQGLAQSEAEWETEAVAQAVPIQFDMAAVPPATLKAVVSAPIQGTPLTGWLNRLKEDEAHAIERQVRLGVLSGETIPQIVARVRGTKANNYTDGVLSMTKRGAEAVVRTSVNHVSNAARAEVWAANEDIVSGLRWTATLDGRTSEVCRSRDGQVFPLRSGPRPPAHFNCRSLMVAVIDGVALVGSRPSVTDTRTRARREVDFHQEAKDKAGEKWKTMTAGQRQDAVRAVRTKWAEENVGRVPAKTTYEEWLRRQPKEFQDDVLGPARGALFREGMTLDKFVDGNGKRLTLDQLKAESKGDALHVAQPGVGLKAKALLQQGHEPAAVLEQIKKEFPEANTSAGSIASYKSELKKAGLLDALKEAVPASSKGPAVDLHSAVKAFDEALPAGVRHALGGQWAQVVGGLEGAPGAYANYVAGKGVQLSAEKLSAVSVAQAKQVMAHELGHLLHKQHDLLPDDLEGLKAARKQMATLPQLKDAAKQYGYYLSHMDELVGEVYAQALSPSPLTSQGLSAAKFNEHFGPWIDSTKAKLALKFLAPKASVSVPVNPGPPSMVGEVAGKHSTVGSLAKALLQQGIPDDDVLAAVKAEFPAAKTSKASLSSYKVELKKQGLLPNKASGPVVKAVVAPEPVLAPPPPANPHADVIGPPKSRQGWKLEVKEDAKKLFEAGVLDNYTVVKTLQAKYALGSEANINYANVASWKSAWKKASPSAAKSAEKAAEKATKAVPPAIEKPKLADATLSPVTRNVLEKLKASAQQGGDWIAAQKIMKASFGKTFDPSEGKALWDLALYEVKVGKVAQQPYLGAIQPKLASVKPEAPAIDLTPTRLATKPSEGMPPPPRFTEDQRAAALRRYLGVSPEGASGYERIAKVQRDLGLEEITRTEYAAMKAYTGSHYHKLNTNLRAGAYSHDQALQAVVEAAQHGLAKMPKHAGWTNRGVTANEGLLRQVLSTHTVGAVVEESAFVSTSTASGFGGNIRMKFLSKTGVDVSKLSHYPSEAEVLFAPGTKFKVTRVEKASEMHYTITMEEV
jgi:SPP1 gp7 family putative phage head morphogenesis protein